VYVPFPEEKVIGYFKVLSCTLTAFDLETYVLLTMK